ncbi:hypothetical protein TNCV_4691231 [Trichonephila clavipes]|nr:hypothetical protein TNCV_4691231 [Trichonephila clavipes]
MSSSKDGGALDSDKPKQKTNQHPVQGSQTATDNDRHEILPFAMMNLVGLNLAFADQVASVTTTSIHALFRIRTQALRQNSQCH